MMKHKLYQYLLIFFVLLVALPAQATEHVTYYVNDALGSPIMAMDEQGAVVWQESYQPYGQRQVKPAAANYDEQFYTGKQEEPDIGLQYFGARWYDPEAGRFTSIDPVGVQEGEIHSFNRYAYANNNPYKFIDPDGRDAVPIVFPNYKISTPLGKLSGLGHAGVLLINNKNGLTKYYEYGRYDSKGKGVVRKRSVPNVELDGNGSPTSESLKKVLSSISQQSGQNGLIQAAYIKNGSFSEMNKFAINKMAENTNSNREDYSLTNNNCGTFMKDVIESGGVSMPSMLDPRPNSYIQEVRNEFPKIDN